MLLNEKIPLSVRVMIEAAGASFERATSASQNDAAASEAIWLAFGVGVMIGSYLNGADAAIPKQAVRLLGSLGGTKSGVSRRSSGWQRLAEELAFKLRQEHPTKSQAWLAAKIEEGLREEFKDPKDQVGFETQKDFISQKETRGNPRWAKKDRSLNRLTPLTKRRD